MFSLKTVTSTSISRPNVDG